MFANPPSDSVDAVELERCRALPGACGVCPSRRVRGRWFRLGNSL